MNPNFIPNGFHHVGNCIRPPSEANAILLQATLGCSHSKCTFCGAYPDKHFALKERKYLEEDFEFAKQHCRRLRASGIKLVTIVLLGLGQLDLSLDHARETGKALTAIDPEAVSALSLMPIPGTPLGLAFEKGEYQIPDALGMIKELRELVNHTTLTKGSFRSVHASNYLSVDARFPQDKEVVLKTLDQALAGNIDLKPEWMRGL